MLCNQAQQAAIRSRCSAFWSAPRHARSCAAAQSRRAAVRLLMGSGNETCKAIDDLRVRPSTASVISPACARRCRWPGEAGTRSVPPVARRRPLLLPPYAISSLAWASPRSILPVETLCNTVAPQDTRTHDSSRRPPRWRTRMPRCSSASAPLMNGLRQTCTTPSGCLRALSPRSRMPRKPGSRQR